MNNPTRVDFSTWTPADVEAHNRRIALGKKQFGASDPIAQEPTSDTQDAPKLESDLHDQIMDFCRPMGWLVVHSRMDRKTTTAKGTSDFIVVTPKSVGFIEAKRKGNKPTPEQLAFLAHVKQMGWPNCVVYNMAEFRAFVEEHLL